MPIDISVIVRAPRHRSMHLARVGATTFLTWKGLIERERMRRFLVEFHQKRLAADEDEVWIGWLQAIALLGLRDVARAQRPGRRPRTA